MLEVSVHIKAIDIEIQFFYYISISCAILIIVLEKQSKVLWMSNKEHMLILLNERVVLETCSYLI